MPKSSGSGPLEIRIDAREFGALLRDAKAFDADLSRRLRKSIREAAKPAVDDVKSAVQSIPAKRDRGVRRGIAAGVGLRINSGSSKGGAVTIAASGNRVPGPHRAMVRLLNKPSWRHPVFGDKQHWVTQSGRPYFGSVILTHRENILRAVEDALNEAAAALGRSR